MDIHSSFSWYSLYFVAQLYISSIAGGIFLNGTIPLFYELSCETSYPIAEGITGAFSTILDSMFGVLFLFILQIPHIGKVQFLDTCCIIIIIKAKVPHPHVWATLPYFGYPA